MTEREIKQAKAEARSLYRDIFDDDPPKRLKEAEDNIHKRSWYVSDKLGEVRCTLLDAHSLFFKAINKENNPDAEKNYTAGCKHLRSAYADLLKMINEL